MANRSRRWIPLLAALLLAPAPAARAADSTTASPTIEPDFSRYQELLNELVTVISAKGEPLDTRFDYEKLYDMKGRYERFARIKRQLLSVPPSRMTDRDRIAWAINTYNFLVIETATNDLLVPGRGRLRYKTVRDIRLPGGSFFQVPVIEVEDGRYSLDGFERRFLFADFEREQGGPPPAGLDPRLHFAVVCGAMGCPPLLPRAYRGDSLEVQLEFATRNALALPRHLALREKTGRIEASAIFDWYAADFGGREKAWEFLLKYAPAKIRAGIAARKLTEITGTISWDWNLNQTVHKKEI